MRGRLNTTFSRKRVHSQPLVIFIILVRIIYLSGKKIADKVGFTSDFWCNEFSSASCISKLDPDPLRAGIFSPSAIDFRHAKVVDIQLERLS